MPSTAFLNDEDNPVSEVEVMAFEGAEKKMEIIFSNVSESHSEFGSSGLRSFGREHWSSVVALLNGSILKHEPHEEFDAYLISESSLFVYADRVVILTCGTTILLKTLSAIMQTGHKIGLDVCWFQYSRKNFLFPEKQHFPHGSFDQEVKFCSQIFKDGQPFILGPMNSDHWYVFLVDRMQRQLAICDSSPSFDSSSMGSEQTLNIYMYGIDQNVAQLFVKAEEMIIPSIFESAPSDSDVKKSGSAELSSGADKLTVKSSSGFVTSAAEASERSGILSLMSEYDGAIDHDHLFDPCGYSMNGHATSPGGIAGGVYWTIHITPEAHCSYVSFETNLVVPSYRALIEKVVGVFRPEKFTVVMQADLGSPLMSKDKVSATVCSEMDVLRGYAANGKSTATSANSNYSIQLLNYETTEGAGACDKCVSEYDSQSVASDEEEQLSSPPSTCSDLNENGSEAGNESASDNASEAESEWAASSPASSFSE